MRQTPSSRSGLVPGGHIVDVFGLSRTPLDALGGTDAFPATLSRTGARSDLSPVCPAFGPRAVEYGSGHRLRTRLFT